MLAETSMHHSSPPFSHYTLYGAQPSLTTPIHHPSSPLSSPTSSTGSTMTPSPDDDRPPDLPCALRFGDIPAASFPAAGARGVLHSPTAVQLLASSEMSPKGEVKVLSRSLSKLGKKNAAESVRNEDAASSEGIAVPILSLSSGEPSCCAGCMVGSPALPEAFLALQKFLPSNNVADDDDEEDELWSRDSWPALDVYSCDEFRMYEFKVRKCVRGRSHDWTECPFAHPGEKARRRDPRRYRYSGTACPDFRKGNCRRGESCEYSHGVFECWLHPTRYRTQPCKDGKNCRRRVCFFAHTPEQLRVVPTEGESPPTTPGSGSSGSGSARSSLLKAAALSGGAYDGSPLRRALAGTLDGSVALELLLDDANKCAAGCHHHHHHWGFGAGSSPSSTLVGLSTGATSPSPMSSPVLPQGSPLVTSVSSWSAVPGHRRHLDRLRSIPRISIPGSEDSSCSPPQESQHTMAELLSTLQSMQLSPGPTAAQSCRTLPSSAWPFLSQLQNPPSQSAPNTPNPRYSVNQTNLVQVNSAEAVTSPYAMKPVTPATNVAASSLNSLSVASSLEISALESDAPDLGWVNDLVQ